MNNITNKLVLLNVVDMCSKCRDLTMSTNKFTKQFKKERKNLMIVNKILMEKFHKYSTKIIKLVVGFEIIFFM